MTSDLITAEEAARILRVNPHTVYRALRAGTLPGGKVGNQWRISRTDLETHIRGRQAASIAENNRFVKGGADQ